MNKPIANDMDLATKMAPQKAAQSPVTGYADPRMYNPGVKNSGAPVPFNPAVQEAMINMFGAPMEGSFDRRMSTPTPPPARVKTDVTPNYDLTNI